MPNDADRTPAEPDATSSPGSPPDPAARGRDEVPVYDRPEPKKGRGLMAALAVGGLVIGLGGGFALGRSTASSGPSTLADAIRLASQGKLSRGDVTTALRSSGGFGLFGNRNGQARGGAGAGGGGARAGANGGGRGGGIQGTIQSMDGNTMTVATQAGTVKVTLTGNTQILKATPGQPSDLTQGVQVAVRPDFTASSSDGSVSASTIETRPQGP